MTRRLTVIPPHQALKFRELIYHLGAEIRFGPARGLVRLAKGRTSHRCNSACQCCDAGDAIPLAAELVMKGNLFQALKPCICPGRSHANVVFPEELRVRQARKQHLLVASKNGLAIVFGLAVGNGHKLLDAPCLRVLHREELLVLFHRGLQHLWRQAKEVLGNITHQHNRPFYKTCNLGQQTFVLNQLQPLGKRHIGGVVPDSFGALFGVQNHPVALQLDLIIFKPVHCEPTTAHKAMAFGGVTGFDAVNIQGNNVVTIFGTQDTQDRVQRAYPPKATRAPAHGFWPREVPNCVFQNLGHNLRRSAPRLSDGRKVHRAFWRLALFQIFAGHSRATQKAVNGFVWRADLWTFALFLNCRALRQQVLNRQRQASRCGKGTSVCIGQTSLNQTIRDLFLKIISGPRLHTCGDFFGEKFDQQIRHDGSLEVHDGLDDNRVRDIDKKG
mmetsp:Transcript_28293/g.52612  ORF Transcript_28293/g.52612 Transcript_28293/m.52612 type:complete len:443 (-) Transcript_28293:1236-2564(-)